jgi:hypothetical protein
VTSMKMDVEQEDEATIKDKVAQLGSNRVV